MCVCVNVFNEHGAKVLLSACTWWKTCEVSLVSLKEDSSKNDEHFNLEFKLRKVMLVIHFGYTVAVVPDSLAGPLISTLI